MCLAEWFTPSLASTPSPAGTMHAADALSLCDLVAQPSKGKTTNSRPGGGGDAKPKSTRGGEGFECENSLKRQGGKGCSRPCVGCL